MTRVVVGRVGHPDTHGVRWVYDTEKRRYVEGGPDIDEEAIMRAIDAEQAGLIQAIRHARERGWTWARIGVILGATREEAQQRFQVVDRELAARGVTLPEDAVTEPLEVPQQPPKLKPVREAPAPEHDFSALGKLSTEEVVAMAQQLPKDGKLYDRYLSALREAIVVTLYKRDITQPQIAKVIGKSSQRVSQIIAGHYARIEQAWAKQRAQRQEGD